LIQFAAPFINKPPLHALLNKEATLMVAGSPTASDKGRSFWDRYIGKLHESGVKPPFDRWFVVRAGQYIETLRGRKPAD
jgi:hypothetical protein